MTTETQEPDRHLTDAELFALAAPASGEPEAIPKHLSACRTCSRALQDWKGAVRALAEKDAGEIGRRTEEEWRAAEDATLEKLKAAPARRRVHPLRWAAAIAASLLVAVLLLPSKRPPASAAAAPATPAATSSSASDLSPADQADDDLLRQASFLAAGGDLEGESGLAGRL
jgi:hypothetical protein